MTTLPEILHNIADHTDTFLRILNEQGISEDLKNRLVDHIILEERENTAILQELHKAGPSPITQKLLDHSFFLQKIMKEQTLPLDLKKELLDHFSEEHTEWQRDIAAGSASPSVGESRAEAESTYSHQHTNTKAPKASPAPERSNASGWTVGPMWTQGE